MPRSRPGKHRVLKPMFSMCYPIKFIDRCLPSGSGSSDCLSAQKLDQQLRFLYEFSNVDVLMSSNAVPATTDRKATLPMASISLDRAKDSFLRRSQSIVEGQKSRSLMSSGMG